MRVSILHLACVLAVGGCASSIYTPNGAVGPRAPRGPESMIVHMAGEPLPAAHTIAGDLRASSGDRARSLEMIRQEAAKNGLDGVMEVVCQPPGTSDEGACTGKAFVFKQ